MKKNFLKKSYLIFNFICFFFFFYFVLRLYNVLKKPLLVPNFTYMTDADYVYYILILCCVVLLGNIFIFLLDKNKEKYYNI